MQGRDGPGHLPYLATCLIWEVAREPPALLSAISIENRFYLLFVSVSTTDGDNTYVGQLPHLFTAGDGRYDQDVRLFHPRPSEASTRFLTLC